MIILSGCDKSPPQPDTWEKMMANTMGVPQNSWRLHTSMRGRIRIIYIFQTDQQWTDCIHLQALKLQEGLDAKVSYSGISTDNILDISGVKNYFNEEIIKNKNILILDDIYTTGATCNECVKTLRNAQPKKIGIITIAKDCEKIQVKNNRKE